MKLVCVAMSCICAALSDLLFSPSAVISRSRWTASTKNMVTALRGHWSSALKSGQGRRLTHINAIFMLYATEEMTGPVLLATYASRLRTARGSGEMRTVSAVISVRSRAKTSLKLRKTLKFVRLRSVNASDEFRDALDSHVVLRAGGCGGLAAALAMRWQAGVRTVVIAINRGIYTTHETDDDVDRNDARMTSRALPSFSPSPLLFLTSLSDDTLGIQHDNPQDLGQLSGYDFYLKHCALNEHTRLKRAAFPGCLPLRSCLSDYYYDNSSTVGSGGKLDREDTVN